MGNGGGATVQKRRDEPHKPAHVRKPQPKRKKKTGKAVGFGIAAVGVCILTAAVFGLVSSAITAAPQPAAAVGVPQSTAQSGSAAPADSQPQQPKVEKVRFSATGDNLIHDGIYLQAAKRTGGTGYDFAPVYENLKEFYAGFDLNWLNQETLITDEIEPSGYPQFCTPAACGQAVYDLGMRVISMSNNHAYDKYAKGVEATLRFWDSMPDDVLTTGLWSDTQQIPVLEKNGITFAFLSYTDYTNGIPEPEGTPARVIYTSEETLIQQQIQQAAQTADVVVVGFHWGVENSHEVSEAQRALAQKAADWGADVIIGTHPHVIQAIETVTSADGRTVPVAYSLGNFVSAQQYADQMISIVLTFDVTKTTQPDGISTVEIGDVKAVPSVTHYDAGYTNIRQYLLRDYTEELAAQHGTRASSGRFDLAYIREVLTQWIDESYLQWD